jgi:hypothetical protein
MTPELLEALEGIDADAVNRIQQAINSFYGQVYPDALQEDAGPQEGGAPEDVPLPAGGAAVTVADQFVDGASEGLESQASDTLPASDTMSESPELAAGAGAEGQSGTELIAGEIPEP